VDEYLLYRYVGLFGLVGVVDGDLVGCMVEVGVGGEVWVDDDCGVVVEFEGYVFVWDGGEDGLFDWF